MTTVEELKNINIKNADKGIGKLTVLPEPDKEKGECWYPRVGYGCGCAIFSIGIPNIYASYDIWDLCERHGSEMFDRFHDDIETRADKKRIERIGDKRMTTKDDLPTLEKELDNKIAEFKQKQAALPVEATYDVDYGFFGPETDENIKKLMKQIDDIKTDISSG